MTNKIGMKIINAINNDGPPVVRVATTGQIMSLKATVIHESDHLAALIQKESGVDELIDRLAKCTFLIDQLYAVTGRDACNNDNYCDALDTLKKFKGDSE
jgi:hypothetical protein